MLTKVILEGPMGERFGREWEFAVCSPREALAMIEANKPGVFAWIRANLPKYARYRVYCEYENGRTEELDSDSYALEGKPTLIRFMPLIEGAGGVMNFVLGAVLIVAGVITGSPWLINMGIGMMINGVIAALSPRPSNNGGNSSNKIDSYYFDGPVNNTQQGNPVPLIYGRVLAGSQAISAAVTVAQLM